MLMVPSFPHLLGQGRSFFKAEAEKLKPYYIPFILLLVILPFSR